jgi:hypothetical protein
LVASRPTASDFSGSATVIVSVRSHLGHSNVRCSAPSGKGAIRASIIRAWHRSQRGHSIGLNLTSGSDALRMILLVRSADRTAPSFAVHQRGTAQGSIELAPKVLSASGEVIHCRRRVFVRKLLSSARYPTQEEIIWKTYLICPVADVRCRDYRISRVGTDR